MAALLRGLIGQSVQKPAEKTPSKCACVYAPTLRRPMEERTVRAGDLKSNTASYQIVQVSDID